MDPHSQLETVVKVFVRDADYGDLRTFNEPALRLCVARGAASCTSRLVSLYMGARTYGYKNLIIQRGHVEYDRWGSLTLAPIILHTSGMLSIMGRA